MEEKTKIQAKHFFEKMDAIKEEEDRAVSELEALTILQCSPETFRRFRKRFNVKYFTIRRVRFYKLQSILRLKLVRENQALVRKIEKM